MGKINGPHKASSFRNILRSKIKNLSAKQAKRRRGEGKGKEKMGKRTVPAPRLILHPLCLANFFDRAKLFTGLSDASSFEKLHKFPNLTWENWPEFSKLLSVISDFSLYQKGFKIPEVSGEALRYLCTGLSGISRTNDKIRARRLKSKATAGLVLAR